MDALGAVMVTEPHTRPRQAEQGREAGRRAAGVAWLAVSPRWRQDAATVRRLLRILHLGHDQLLHGLEADRFQQYVIEAAGEEALLLFQQPVGGVGDHP